MNRRTFLAASAIAPFATIQIPIREVREAILISKSTEAHIIVTAYIEKRSAELHRREWIGRPFAGFGEFYVDICERRQLPGELAQLPATLTHHRTTIGVAAERREYLVCALRRQNISAIVRIQGDQEPLMVRIIEHIADVNLPTQFEVAWSPVLLKAFVPTMSDIGMTIEVSSAFWP